jgi:hypothetical protein
MRQDFYKQQSRRPMSENRRLCLSPYVPSLSAGSEVLVGYSDRNPQARSGFVRPALEETGGRAGSTKKAYNFARSPQLYARQQPVSIG